MPARDPFGVIALLKDVVRRVKHLEAGAFAGFTSITRGSLRVASNEGLLVQGSEKVEGWLIVTGTERVTGTLEVLGILTGTGEIIWTGPAKFSGDSEIGGTLKVTGATTLQGLVTLLNDLVVSGAGRIKVGTAMTLDPSDAAGALVFSSGAKLQADSGGARLISGTGPRVYAFPTSAGIQYSPTLAVQVTASAVNLVGPVVAATLPTITRASANNAVVGTVWANPTTGQLFRVV